LRVGDLFARLKQRTVALKRLYSYRQRTALGKGATVTTRNEKMKMQRRMQRRIRLVVEERRMSRPDLHAEPSDPGEATIEIPVAALLPPAPAPPAERAIGRVAVRSA
jgi:hypothetical protein